MFKDTFPKPIPPDADSVFIPRARQLMKPSRRKSIYERALPRWFCKAVRAAYCLPRPHSWDRRGTDVLNFLDRTFPSDNRGFSWLDHVGSTDYFGNDAFVSEPYGVSLCNTAKSRSLPSASAADTQSIRTRSISPA